MVRCPSLARWTSLVKTLFVLYSAVLHHPGIVWSPVSYSAVTVVWRGTHAFYKVIVNTSAVSSMNLGPALIFSSCVIHGPLVFADASSFEYIYIYGVRF